MISLLWTLAASATAIAIGLTTSTLALVTFGGVSLLDAAGSLALVMHFRHAQRTGDLSERHEGAALRVVTAGLIVVGAATIAASAHRLATGTEPDVTFLGLALAAASAIFLAQLAPRKRRLGEVVPSHALRTDGVVSAIGAGLAVITLVGAALTALLGAWWVDPIAALTVAAGAVIAGVVLART